MFIGPRSLYLITFDITDMKEATTTIGYWLQLIYTRAPKSPVILVGTHDEKLTEKYVAESFESLLEKYKSGFPNIKSCFSVSNKNGKGTEDLREKIINVALEEKFNGRDHTFQFQPLRTEDNGAF